MSVLMENKKEEETITVTERFWTEPASSTDNTEKDICKLDITLSLVYCHRLNDEFSVFLFCSDQLKDRTLMSVSPSF